jgi:hypothetical protein
MSIFTIYADRSGVERVTATVRTIAESSSAAEAMQAAALPLKLLSDTLRAHFAGQAVTQSADANYPGEELDVYVCACGSRFHSAGEAVDHVEADHASPRIRQDLDKLEDTIEGLITPCPLAPLPEPTVIVKDRTFAADLVNELGELFAELKIGNQKTAIELVDYCGWGEVAGLNYEEVKVRILDEVGGKKIGAPLQEAFLTAMALFLSQVGRLSKKYGKYGSK